MPVVAKTVCGSAKLHHMHYLFFWLYNFQFTILTLAAKESKAVADWDLFLPEAEVWRFYVGVEQGRNALLVNTVAQ